MTDSKVQKDIAIWFIATLIWWTAFVITSPNSVLKLPSMIEAKEYVHFLVLVAGVGPIVLLMKVLQGLNHQSK